MRMRTCDMTADQLRAYYGHPESADLFMVLHLLGDPDIDTTWAVAYRYPSTEAHDAFADGNQRHHGHQSLGPATGPDGAVYGITIMDPPGRHP